MKVYILDSGIVVGKEINEGPGKIGKMNKCLFWNLEYATKVV